MGTTAVDAGFVLGKMEDAQNQLNIVILDACRNNPFSRNFRTADRGLARMDAPTGSLIVYATAPGEVAADGDGPERNGVFTKHLIKHMQTPNIPIEQMLKRVRIDVATETQQRQIPWESSSLMGDFFFVAEKITLLEEAKISTTPMSNSAEISSLSKTSEGIIGKNNSKIKLCIFPIMISSSSYPGYPRGLTKSNFIELREQVIISIKKSIIENDIFNPTFSYYSLEKEFRSREIPSEVIDEKIFMQMWRGDTFQMYKVPDIDLFCKIGEKLQVDVILTCWLSVADKDLTMKAFLIEVKKYKLFQASEFDKIETAHAWPLHYLNMLPGIANKAMLNVFEQFSSSQ